MILAAPPPALLKPAALHATAPATYNVAFATTKGRFLVTVHRAWSPRGADRFYNLVRARFYDGVEFFRVVKGFVVQFGISQYPMVSTAWQNATIKDDPVKTTNARATITFADGGPNAGRRRCSSTSQAIPDSTATASRRSAASRPA